VDRVVLFQTLWLDCFSPLPGNGWMHDVTRPPAGLWVTFRISGTFRGIVDKLHPSFSPPIDFPLVSFSIFSSVLLGS
jgi:hypothetical protein